jgi:aldehyde:ferredoxin oxidoreductase
VAAKWFYDTGKMQCSPLAPEAPLFVMTGLLTGVNVPTACKASFCGRSPATGIWSESTVGGRWPSALRSCGFDGMIISGCSAEPVYLYLCEDKVELREAGYLWGKDVYATQEAIGEEVEDENLRVAAIGPAGERQVLIAGIIIDGHDARAAGRGGMGAVMGSKRLKAIAVSKGKKTPKPYDPDALAPGTPGGRARIREKTRGLTDYGTAGGVPVVEKLGDLPIRNWTGGSWTEGAPGHPGRPSWKTLV